MKAKSVTLLNTGMNRDLSQSKVSNNCVWENHNIRIVANDTATMLSITNERGTKVIPFSDNQSIPQNESVVGWNMLDNHIILFTINEEDNKNRIYKCDYSEEDNTVSVVLLFVGNLGFSYNYPIESIVHYESESVQKIYWVDGVNVLRFMNFMASKRTVTYMGQQVQRYPWQADDGTYDETYFDSNRAVVFSAGATIEKDWSGNNRPNGTIQYILTYYNRYGQESGPAWCSDIVYLSPMNNGGEADGTNSTCVKLSFTNLDTRFDHFKVYSIFRSTLNGQVNANIVADRDIPSSGTAHIVDDNSHYTAVDTTQILYLGSKNTYPYTIAQKDNILFIGNFDSPDSRNYSAILTEIKNNYINANTGLSKNKITFTTSGTNGVNAANIPYVEKEGLYSYDNQLKYSSSEITTFKSGEKYRFALKVGFDDGSSPVLFWIGDAVNDKHPFIDATTHSISRPIAQCTITHQLHTALTDIGAKTVQLMIAEATYSDRKILAQGVVNPTVFNVWERYNGRLYAMPSWVTRPRRSGIASRHFEALKESNNPNCEIQCNFPLNNTFLNVYPSDENVTIKIRSYFASGIFMVILEMRYDGVNYKGDVILVEGSTLNNQGKDSLYNWDFKDKDGNAVQPYDSYTDESETPAFVVTFNHRMFNCAPGLFDSLSTVKTKVYEAYKGAIEQFGVAPVLADTFGSWVEDVQGRKTLFEDSTLYFNDKHTSGLYSTFRAAATDNDQESSGNWHEQASSSGSENRIIQSGDSQGQAKFRKNIMFVDESVVTLNSPEIEFESVHPDSVDYGFRIVGISKVSSQMTDFTVDASMGKQAGRNLYERYLSDTIINIHDYPKTAWPLWTEKSLEESSNSAYTYEEVQNRLSDYYIWGNDSVRYWLYMWNHSGVLTGYYPTTDYSNTSSEDGVHVSVDDNSDRYSYLRNKTFANLTFCYDTIYGSTPWVCDTPKSLRIFNQTSSRTTVLNVGNETRYYDGVIDMALTMPEGFKYPVYYSTIEESVNSTSPEALCYLYSSDPIYIKYATRPHAVISLPGYASGGTFTQTVLPILPKTGDDDYDSPIIPDSEITVTWPLPNSANKYLYDQGTLNIQGITGPYLFIGEIYKKITDGGADDTRYGGITESAARNCRYIPASPQTEVSNNLTIVYGDRGDTYFQRWDCLRTVPLSTYDDNSVIDIVSVMLETHINIDGRTDKYRGTKKIASIDTAQFGQINPVYSQPDNFLVRRIDEQEYRNDDYRTHVSWTMEKHDMADVDEWSHITLANSLPLDASRGVCRALRSFRNSIVSFQDKGISEILFNPRVQVAASDGVPIELANSGKVEGKRYITTNYGCLNKWSIAEGKKALYFVDSLNKAFCSFNGSQIENISLKLGFSTWFKNHNSLIPWDIERTDDNSIISFYDKINSDVYLVRGNDDDNMGTLVYNENLDTFTSFFDYHDINLMANVSDKFVSFKLGNFWQHNAGFFCKLHGTQYDFWTQFRVAPNPDTDKIWTNIEYRADFYRILDNNGNRLESVTDEILDGGEHFNNNTTVSGVYQPNETFSSIKVWNEYQQTTPNVTLVNPIKRFRIWRYIIPRAVPNTSNKYGFDRIRNPWINVLFKKTYTSTQEQVPEEAKDLMQLHDVEVQYYE